MLSEEALILLAALGAVGLLILGTLELLWPSHRKRPSRREPLPAPAVAAAVPRAVAAMPSRRRWRSNHPRHAAGAAQRYPKPGMPTRSGASADDVPNAAAVADPAVVADSAVVADPTLAAPLAAAIALAPAAVDAPAAVPLTLSHTPPPAAGPRLADTGPLVDQCFELYQAERYTDVVALTTAALSADAPPTERAADAAEAGALGSMLALARQALGDHAGARAALETAMAVAPEADRATYRRQLTTLTLGVARELITAAAAPVAPESEGRVRDLRDALSWLEPLRVADPDDADVRELVMTAETRLWRAYEHVVMALLQRQGFREARVLLREALDDARLPSTRAEAFRELLSGTFSGEIGQLTAQAIRSMQEARESEALAALERAERLLRSVHEETLSPKRREEVDRRLWWGYNQLGVRRLAAGAFEDAVEPLVHALGLAATAPDRQMDTRAALIQAFEGWTDACALAIREAANAGDREAAIVRSDTLRARLHAALQEGLAERELSRALARAHGLVEEIAQAPP